MGAKLLMDELRERAGRWALNQEWTGNVGGGWGGGVVELPCGGVSNQEWTGNGGDI